MIRDRVCGALLCLLGIGVLHGPPAAAGLTELIQRQHIFVVGSSTAYPIVAAAAENFGRRAGMTTPVVESTGSGGGIKLFCSGQGLTTPDITTASRRMKDSERTDCARNGVNDIREIKLGYDGIVIASSKQAPRFDLTPRELYLALARSVPAAQGPHELVPNPYRTWQQISPTLPNIPIHVLGPPPTSGTRDILVERLLQDACLEVAVLRDLNQRDRGLFEQRCYALREDGAFENAGENDTRLVRKLINDPGALGILGFNFLDRNRDQLQAATIDGVSPGFETIESGSYPLTRPLYFYVKPGHAAVVPGLNEFVDSLVSAQASGPEGYLVDQGLIPVPAGERARATAVGSD